MLRIYPDHFKPVLALAKATIGEEIGLVAALPEGFQDRLSQEIRRHLENACRSHGVLPEDSDLSPHIAAAVEEIRDAIAPRYTRRELDQALELIREMMHLMDSHLTDDDHGGRNLIRRASAFWEEHQPDYDPQIAARFCPYCSQERGSTCACPSCPDCGTFNLPDPVGPTECSACSTQYSFPLRNCPKCNHFGEPGPHGQVICLYCGTDYNFFA